MQEHFAGRSDTPAKPSIGQSAHELHLVYKWLAESMFDRKKVHTIREKQNHKSLRLTQLREDSAFTCTIDTVQ